MAAGAAGSAATAAAVAAAAAAGATGDSAVALADLVLLPQWRYQRYLANFSATLDLVEESLARKPPRPDEPLEIGNQLWTREDQLYQAIGCPYTCDERRCTANNMGRCSARAMANIWALQAPLALLRYLLYAFASASPEHKPHAYTQGRWRPQWALHFLRAALAWGLEPHATKPIVWAAAFPPAWLAKAPRRWPLADGLLGTVLRGVGCPRPNASLRHVLGSGFAGVGSCREDLAVLDTRQWARRAIAGEAADSEGGDLFDALMPCLLGRTAPRRMLHHQVLSSVLHRHLAPDASEPGALFLEFGVHKGASLQVISQHLRQLGAGRAYGFDSFEGLPQAWPGGGTDGWGGLPQGHFKVDALPEVDQDHAELVVGFFNESVPGFLASLPRNPAPRLRLVHLDADLYSSTLEVLGLLRPLLAAPSAAGCLLVLDDLVNFEGFRAPTSALAALEAFLRGEVQRPEPWALARLEVVMAPSVLWGTGYFDDARGDWTDERTVVFRVLPALSG